MMVEKSRHKVHYSLIIWHDVRQEEGVWKSMKSYLFSNVIYVCLPRHRVDIEIIGRKMQHCCKVKAWQVSYHSLISS